MEQSRSRGAKSVFHGSSYVQPDITVTTTVGQAKLNYHSVSEKWSDLSGVRFGHIVQLTPLALAFAAG